MIKEAVRGIRNVRTGMNVPPSKKAKVFVVSESENVRNTFENGKVFFATLGSASEVTVQADRSGIDEDAVSAVLPEAVIYMPFAELVDIDKEIERLQKEEQRLTKELARVNGMLSNERFMSKAPESKVAEERAKLEKYSQMMDQVKERLTHLQGKDRKQDASGILTVKKVVLYFVRNHFAASGKTGHRKGNAYVIAVDLRPIRQWKIVYTL